MSISTKTIKSRLKSIGNTKKITGAMEMVAATKMRRAVESVLASRDYSNSAWNMVLNLSKKVDRNLSPLLIKKEKIEKIGIVLISSNRGLCGGFNNQIMQIALRYIENMSTQGGQETQIIDKWVVMGKKGSEFLARNKKEVVAQFEKPDLVNSTQEITPLTSMVIEDYLSGKYDKIMLVYTDYYSAMIQKPRIKQLLPIEEKIDEELGGVKNMEDEEASENTNEYIFEPSPAEVLNQFLPRLIEIQVYQALLESNASEHSARMIAMKNASEAATDMMSELTLIYNQARQASITREIAEISGGKAALE